MNRLMLLLSIVFLSIHNVYSDSESCPPPIILSEVSGTEGISCQDCNCYNERNLVEAIEDDFRETRREIIHNNIRDFSIYRNKLLMEEIMNLIRDLVSEGVDLNTANSLPSSCSFDRLLSDDHFMSCGNESDPRFIERHRVVTQMIEDFDEIAIGVIGSEPLSTSQCLSDFEVNGTLHTRDVIQNRSRVVRKLNRLFSNPQIKEAVTSFGGQGSLADFISLNQGDFPRLSGLNSMLDFGSIANHIFKSANPLELLSILEEKGTQGLNDFLSTDLHNQDTLNVIKEHLGEKCESLFEDFHRVQCSEPASDLIVSESANNLFLGTDPIDTLSNSDAIDNSEEFQNLILYCHASNCANGICENEEISTGYNVDELYTRLTDGVDEVNITNPIAFQANQQALADTVNANMCPLFMCEKIDEAVKLVKNEITDCSPKRTSRKDFSQIMSEMKCDQIPRHLDDVVHLHCDDKKLKDYIEFFNNNRMFNAATGSTLANSDTDQTSNSQRPRNFLSVFRGEVGRRVDRGESIFADKERQFISRAPSVPTGGRVSVTGDKVSNQSRGGRNRSRNESASAGQQFSGSEQAQFSESGVGQAPAQPQQSAGVSPVRKNNVVGYDSARRRQRELKRSRVNEDNTRLARQATRVAAQANARLGEVIDELEDLRSSREEEQEATQRQQRNNGVAGVGGGNFAFTTGSNNDGGRRGNTDFNGRQATNLAGASIQDFSRNFQNQGNSTEASSEGENSEEGGNAASVAGGPAGTKGSGGGAGRGPASRGGRAAGGGGLELTAEFVEETGEQVDVAEIAADQFGTQESIEALVEAVSKGQVDKLRLVSDEEVTFEFEIDENSLIIADQSKVPADIWEKIQQINREVRERKRVSGLEGILDQAREERQRAF